MDALQPSSHQLDALFLSSRDVKAGVGDLAVLVAPAGSGGFPLTLYCSEGCAMAGPADVDWQWKNRMALRNSRSLLGLAAPSGAIRFKWADGMQDSFALDWILHGYGPNGLSCTFRGEERRRFLLPHILDS